MSSPVVRGRRDYVRALHDFHSSTQSGTATLEFSAGQVIRVFNKDTSGWWDGELDGTRGWFPSNYVELLQPAAGEAPDGDDDDDDDADADAHGDGDEQGAYDEVSNKVVDKAVLQGEWLNVVDAF